MATYCLKPIRGRVMRITKLDACGAPVHGAKATVVTDGFVSVEMRINIEDPTTYKLKGANDKFIVNSTGLPIVNWVDLTLNMGSVDPEAYTLMTGMPLELNDAATPESVGFRLRENVSANFALELWTDLEGQTCAVGTVQYGYLLLPYIVNGVPGDVTVENGPISFPIQNARTHNASQWGVGPYNVVNKLTGSPGPSPLLTAITSTDHYLFELTTLAPPAASCGAVTLP